MLFREILFLSSGFLFLATSRLRTIFHVSFSSGDWNDFLRVTVSSKEFFCKNSLPWIYCHDNQTDLEKNWSCIYVN